MPGPKRKNKARPAVPSGKPQSYKGCRARDALLLMMGYLSYQAYLKSALWASIREKVLADAKECHLCRDVPTQIHHTRYDRPTLLGRSYKYLIPICVPCHRFIEFQGPRKRTMDEVAETLSKLRDAKLASESITS